MDLRLIFSISLVLLLGCKKDCLEKGKCELSTYQSAYLEEQVVPPTDGNIYYIDAEDGKKNNDGTSETKAFKSADQLEDLILEPGDQILFKRGQIHYGKLEIKESGTANAPIIISAYGTGELPVFKSEDGSYDKSDMNTIFLNRADYVHILNLNLQGGNTAVMLSNSDFFKIAGCRIGERSNSGLRATAEYTEGDGSDFGEMHHCLVYSGLSGNLGDLQSTDGIQLMDGASNWHVHHNEFKAWAHSAVTIKQIYSLEENNNNLIEHNYIECKDIDYMRALDMTGGDHLVEGNVFSRNIVRNQTVTSHVHGNNNTVAYNLFLGVQQSSASSQPWAFDFHVFNNQVGGEERKSLVCYNNYLYNNLVYNYNGGTGVRIIKSMDGSDHYVHDCYVINNMFINTAQVVEMDDEPTNIVFENNLAFNSGSTPSFLYQSSTYDLSGFEGLNGSNGFVIQNNLAADPLFVNSATEDFTLHSGSPAIDAGKNVGLTTDYAGKLISANPDIGAFEF